MTDPLPDGWLTQDEARALADLAAGKTVLELGAYKGRSTVVMAPVAAYVVSVDRHNGIPPFHEGDTLPEYLAAVRDLSNVTAVLSPDWHDFTRFLAPGLFSMVYVDGDHDYIAAERDAILAASLEPTVVAFHDLDFPPVLEAARTIFGDMSGRVGSLGWYER